MNSISDDTILTLLQNGTQQEKGFRLLMQKYQERLYRQIRRMVGTHEDTNDVLQNVLVKVFRSIDRFEGKSQLYTWLYRIASNEAITHLKKQKRQTTSSIDDEEVGLQNRLFADSYFDANAAQQHLQNALTTLPDKQRTVFNMRYYDELSYQEISDMLETSVGALKASYHHAVKKIEAFFKEQGVG